MRLRCILLVAVASVLACAGSAKAVTVPCSVPNCPIAITDNPSLPATADQGASPYPSNIAVAGVPAGQVVFKVTVTLTGLAHTFPDDVDVLLVGPTGTAVEVMSDAGAGTDIANVNLTFDDAASSSLSDGGPTVSGTYKPSNYSEGGATCAQDVPPTSVNGDPFPAPAPAAPAAGYGQALSAFQGSDPNGTWKLYVGDDCNGDAGSLTSWSLNITTSGPPPAMTFTPNVRADAGEGGTTGQNEPQVAVDQTGRAYVYWQGNNRLSSTDDGVSFTYLGNPIPNGNTGDTAVTTTTWPSFSHTPTVAGSGDNGIFLSVLGSNLPCGVFQMHGGTSKDRGASWTPVVITACQPFQVDRNWTAAYTPPAYRGTAGATSNTFVYNEYHDFGPSVIWVATSTDGGATYPTAPVAAMQPGSVQQATSTCDTVPGGIAVAQRGGVAAHEGRVYAVWSTSDFGSNQALGCNITQAEAFDHIFLSYSDDNGATWTSKTVFNDPCAPNPPAPPVTPTDCQDVSEIFTSVAVDDAGNVFVAFVFRDISQQSPEYDVYVVESTDGGNTFSAPRKVNQGTGTHYFPWITAGQANAIDVVYYDSTTVEGAATGNKPAAAPHSATWNVKLAQSFDGGLTFTESQVSDASNYFGDICTTGIFCGNGFAFGWGDDRILLDDFGVAIGPDGGARVAWTDARDSHTGQCTPAGTSPVSCQTTHLYFACQTSGRGLHGENVTGCGASTTTAVAVSSFRARRAARGVTVTWRTASEASTIGFNVWRAGSSGPWRKLNARLIPAAGRTGGASYRFADRTARRGSGYRYRLELVGRDGSTRSAALTRVGA